MSAHILTTIVRNYVLCAQVTLCEENVDAVWERNWDSVLEGLPYHLADLPRGVSLGHKFKERNSSGNRTKPNIYDFRVAVRDPLNHECPGTSVGLSIRKVVVNSTFVIE